MQQPLLLVNDDGVLATGLRVLFEALTRDRYDVKVIAPDRNCSGSSSSLTLLRPLRTSKFNDFLALDGTPSDCGHLGAHGVFGFIPGCIISGINQGANLGDDVIYSGTVAAAIEGRYLQYTPMAVSLCGSKYFETAAFFLLKILKQVVKKDLQMPHCTVLNINVPDLPIEEVLGVEITRLGKRNKATTPQTLLTPRGDEGHWLGNVGSPRDDGLGTDFKAIESGKVSVTPLHIDLTDYSAFDTLAKLNLEECFLAWQS